VAEFIADGLSDGQRVFYAASGSSDKLMADLSELTGVEEAIRRGAMRLMSLDEMYRSDEVVVPELQVAAYAAATDEAVAEGYTGLRVAAEATPLVRLPEQLEAFARYEHLVDSYMVDRPFSALCAYNRAELGDSQIVQLACMHPAATEGTTTFNLHATTDHELALSGELDVTVRDVFPLALARARPQPRDGVVRIDATGLSFIDHRSLLALETYARQHEMIVLLAGIRSTGPARLVEILELTAVQVEPAR
jgi:ABC-type transporter Mla MlaB component